MDNINNATMESPDENETMPIKDKLIDMIQNNPDFPALGSSISKVVQLTSSEDKSLEQLTNFILSDPSLSLKILRLSNSLSYRSASPMVTSISKAIQLLGLDTIKTCALAMILVDGMPGKNARAVRAELMLALSASLIGRNLAKRSAFPNAEEVAIAALFKNMGRLILAAHNDQLYWKTMSLAREKGYSEGRASLEQLGCTFNWLTEFALKAWHIPESIILAMKIMPGKVLRSPKNRSEWMQQVAEFSNNAALMTLKEGNEIPVVDDLLSRFGDALDLDKQKLNALIRNSSEQIQSICRYAEKITDSENSHAGQNQTAGDFVDCLTDELSDANTCFDQTEDCYASGKPYNSTDRLLTGIQEVSEMLAFGRSDINSLLVLVLETLYRSLGFRFVTVCLKDVRTNQFRARNFVGQNHNGLQKSFVFPDTASSDIFSMAIKRNVDLAISDTTDTKISNALPSWHKQLLPDTLSFMILPLVIQDKPIGLIYADRSAIASEGITANEMKLIKSLKAQILMAMSL
ncbi:MAG: HDOD domain-containing protein [Burkholderiales bacterium]|nr:HDOD domain-containing protein [Nitrosomonas sp.]MCP5274178.1 HDOD domain-containing protein [Burkholderiales bacterium]